MYKFYFLASLTILFLGCKKTNDSETDKIESFDRTQIFENIINENVEPSLKEIESSIKKLNTDIILFTNSPENKRLNDIQDRWKSIKYEWEMYNLYGIGKVKESFLHSKIDRWPTHYKEIEETISSEKISNVNTIAYNQIGLPAIEYLIFMNGDNHIILDSFSTGTFAENRKVYLQKTGESLEETFTEINMIWQNYKNTFITSTQDGYAGSLSELVNAQVSLLEKMIQTKIALPSGIATENTDIELAEAYKSEYSLECIEANLKSIKSSLTAGDEKYSILKYASFLNENNELEIKILSQILECETVINSFDHSLEQSFTTDKSKVTKLYDELKELLILVKVDLANRLGVTITFTDNDGD